MAYRFDGTFGKRLNLLRDDLGLTQIQLTNELAKVGVKIGRTYISKLEGSHQIPSGEVVQGLAKVLGCSADYLLMLSDVPTPQDSAEPNTLYLDDGIDTELVQRIVDAFTKLSRADQEMIIGMARRLREAENPHIVGG